MVSIKEYSSLVRRQIRQYLIHLSLLVKTIKLESCKSKLDFDVYVRGYGSIFFSVLFFCVGFHYTWEIHSTKEPKKLLFKLNLDLILQNYQINNIRQRINYNVMAFFRVRIKFSKAFSVTLRCTIFNRRDSATSKLKSIEIFSMTGSLQP